MKKYLLPVLKFGLPVLIILSIGYLIAEIPEATSIDFSTLQNNFSYMTKGNALSDEELEVFAGIKDNIEDIKRRTSHLNENRARYYIESATRDYHNGSYNEALRRLDRARIYDSSNYNIFKLSGQIFFEQSKFRKAFNDWERANELPNNDKTIKRDIDIMRRLIRYSRVEIDRLQQVLNKNPYDRIASTRLVELREQVLE